MRLYPPGQRTCAAITTPDTSAVPGTVKPKQQFIAGTTQTDYTEIYDHTRWIVLI